MTFEVHCCSLIALLISIIPPENSQGPYLLVGNQRKTAVLEQRAHLPCVNHVLSLISVEVRPLVKFHLYVDKTKFHKKLLIIFFHQVIIE